MTLIERLQALTGPDREVDLIIYLNRWPESEIASITKYRRGLDSADGYSWDILHGAVIFQKMQDGRCPHNGGYPLPAFTGSIDAAMTLVPEWASIELTISAARDVNDRAFTRCRLWDWRRSPVGFDAGNEWLSEGRRLVELNVCIAATKAREAQHEQ